jgi:hypothetical protein
MPQPDSCLSYRSATPSSRGGTPSSRPGTPSKRAFEVHEHDDYIEYLLSETQYECCMCRGKANNTATWVPVRRKSAGPDPEQKNTAALMCEQCSSKPPCAKCKFDLSNHTISITKQPTGVRLELPDDPAERRLYFWLCHYCGKAREAPAIKNIPFETTIPLTRGRRLSFGSRSGARGEKPYIDLGEQKCRECQHSICKICVCFEAPNAVNGSGEHARRSRRPSVASKFMDALTGFADLKLKLVKPEGEFIVNRVEKLSEDPPAMAATSGPDPYVGAGMNRKNTHNYEDRALKNRPLAMSATAERDVRRGTPSYRQNTVTKTKSKKSRKERRTPAHVGIPELTEVIEKPKVSPPEPGELSPLRPGEVRPVSRDC